MWPARCGVFLFAVLAGTALVIGQTPGVDIVADVRAAMAAGGIAQAERTLSSYRSTHPTTPEAIEALSWLARGALAAKLFDKAEKLAGETRDLAGTAIKTSRNDRAESQLHTALGSAIQTLAFVLVAQGARSDAVYLLKNESERYRDLPIRSQLETDLRQVSLEGQRAPALEPGLSLGPRRPGVKDSTRQPTLLFFWAHWCQECKAESPILSKLIEKYRPQGLTIVAPTRRYGYVEAGRPATPDKELRYIAQVRDTFYRFLQHEPVPVTDANHRQYGVSAVPMHVLIDRKGIVRLYRPGLMPEPELEAAILETLRD
jgi:thiol-disulfide isomerase/thioredoxin